MARLKDTPCPHCGVTGGVSVTSTLYAAPAGTYSLTGRTPKLTAHWRPVLVCAGCDLYVVGQYTPDGNACVFGDDSGGDDPVKGID